MKAPEIIPAASTPTGVDRQRGFKTPLTRALWRLVQAAVNKPGDALSSTAVVFNDRRAAVTCASRIRVGRHGTVNNAIEALGAVGKLEVWAEEHHYGHTLGMRFLPATPPTRIPAEYDRPALATVQAREAANL